MILNHYKHDCEKCIYVGSMPFKDVYLHASDSEVTRVFTIRYSNQPDDYVVVQAADILALICKIVEDKVGAWSTSMPATVIREPLARFAEVMELKLQSNDYKGGWEDDEASTLIRKIYDEVREMYYEYKMGHIDQLKSELVDVANFCMMLHDNLARRYGASALPRV